MPLFKLTPIDSALKALVLRGHRVTIGRSPDCTLALAVEKASRQHAAIDLVGDTWVIRDLGSRNGITVNQQRVSEHRLETGDVIKIGSHEFLVESEGPVALDLAGKGS